MSELITVAGQRIEVASSRERPGRPTLVFLHEGLGSAGLWRDFPARLAAATRCNWLAYSRLGYGRSAPARLPRPVRYMHDEAHVTLPALLRQLTIEEHLLIGHSDGGSIALIYAGQHAPGLLGVITEAAHVFNEPLSVQSIRAARAAYLEGDLRARLSRYHQDVDNAFWGWNDVWLQPEFLTWNIEKYLPGIQAPLLVLQGEDDQYGSLAQVEAIVQGVSGPVQSVILPNCQHTPHREQPEETLAAMVVFITKLMPDR